MNALLIVSRALRFQAQHYRLEVSLVVTHYSHVSRAREMPRGHSVEPGDGLSLPVEFCKLGLLCVEGMFT